MRAGCVHRMFDRIAACTALLDPTSALTNLSLGLEIELYGWRIFTFGFYDRHVVNSGFDEFTSVFAEAGLMPGVVYGVKRKII